MTRAICSLGVVLMLAGTAQGAFLYLENAADGSASMDLAPGESGEMNIVMLVHGIDPAVWLVSFFLDAADELSAENLLITGIVSGDWCEVDFPKDELPLTFEDFGFGLSCDPQEPPVTLLLVTLVVTHVGRDTAGSVEITFEEGARKPNIVAEPPDFIAFVWGLGFAGILPAFSDPVVGGQTNPFVINLVPSSEECEGDANGDGVVDPLDSGFVLARFGCKVEAGDPDCDTADQNDDGVVDPLDVGFVLARFGSCE
ncbi:MAG: hypothetical protein IID37_08205 [Planctomycetes bacterium]|nr:hypothetical protein [Planctomycetota bacterium]